MVHGLRVRTFRIDPTADLCAIAAAERVQDSVAAAARAVYKVTGVLAPYSGVLTEETPGVWCIRESATSPVIARVVRIADRPNAGPKHKPVLGREARAYLSAWFAEGAGEE